MDSETVFIIWKRLSGHVALVSWSEIAASLVGFVILLSFLRPHPPRVPGAPVHGYKSKWEPSLFLRWRYVFASNEIIAQGYRKLKNSPFVIRRLDTDVTVLPIKYLEETRLLARDKFTGKIPVAKSIVTDWTWTEFVLDSDLHVQALKSMLTPKLNKFLELAREELDYCWDIELPKSQEWTKVDIQEIARNLVARTSAKVFVGEPACRDPEWLDISVNYTVDVFATAYALRMFPPWTHPLVAQFVPARWRLRKQLRTAKKIIGGLIESHVEKKGSQPDNDEQDTVLGWMMDHGSEKEVKLPEMAGRQCILTLASIHSTSSALSNVIFDLCAHPEWIPVLRDEVEKVTRECGELGENKDMLAKQWLAKLEKMDSFFVETQRVNAPILLRPQRVAMVPLTLKDGTHIPKGAQVAWAGHDYSNDAAVAPNPSAFDPMRNYRRRHEGAGENRHKFTAGQTDINSLSFGYGSQACPGRYFAVVQAKMILARLLVEYDMALPEGEGRPVNSYVEENVVIDPGARLMMRKRRTA